ncbi:MAG: TlpA disulfide reductase family protein [Solirubrobacterales bacterium]
MQRERSKFVIPVVVVVAALLALLIYGVVEKNGGGRLDDAVAEGRRELAPVREVRKLGSNQLTSIAEHRGKVVVLNFWASWCEPCKEEAPAIERAYQKYKDDGMIVIGADVDDLTKDAQQFVREFKITYPIIRYGSAHATDDFGATRFPETFVIDRKGRVVALQRYQVDDKWLDAAIAPVVAEPR